MTAAVSDAMHVVVYQPPILPGRATLTLTWRDNDPYRVAADITVRAGTTRWPIGWELLSAGLHRPAGIGDIQLGPIPNRGMHWIWFDNGQQPFKLKVPSNPLHAFMADVQAVWTDRHVGHALDRWIEQALYRRPAPPPPAG